MDFDFARISVLSLSLGFFIYRTDSQAVVQFFQARENLLKRLQSTLKFLERVVNVIKAEAITSRFVEHWLTDLEKAFLDIKKLSCITGLMVGVSVSSQSGQEQEEMKEAMEKGLKVNLLKIDRLAQEMVEYLGEGSFMSAHIRALFDRVASCEVVDFFKSRDLSDGLLLKFQKTLASVHPGLDDAEEKEISDSAVKQWLGEVKHAIYEADDLLDEIGYESLRPDLTTNSQTQVRRKNLFSNEMLKEKEELKLEEIIERLEYLVRQKDLFGLKWGIGERKSTDKHDKEAIMRLLLSDDANDPIVSVCRVGKTSLAQLLYNDDRVDMFFDFKAWVCVSDDSDVCRITKDFPVHPGSKDCERKTLNQIEVELEERLFGKRFLLVLECVWNNEYADQEISVRPLKSGAQGSKIIVTMCNTSVASVERNATTRHLEELTNDDCWLLGAKHALKDGNPVAHPHLEAIAGEIAREYKGLPLVAEALESLLCSRRDARELGKVFGDIEWNLQNHIILPALRLSYLYLPSHLKRCFAYCAIFPKGYEFKREAVILLWIAEGLVQPYGDVKVEESAEEYFHDLVSMSYFQQSSSNQSCFVLHDLVNDLANCVAGDFCFRLEDDRSCDISKNTRHLSYIRTEYDAFKKFTGIYDAKHLRTFLPLGPSQSWQYKHIDERVTHVLLSAFKHLRVLSLSQYHNVVELSDSFGNLKHLRYLNLSATSIQRLPETVSSLYYLQTLILHDCRDLAQLPDSINNLKHLRYLNLHGLSIKRLPESMSGLHSLQTLILSQCKELVELPAKMAGLINLCHLDIQGTKLQEMPPQMGKLAKLKRLTHFIVGEHSGSSIKELGKLCLLRGDLCIWKLQNVNAPDVSAVILGGKKHLKELELRWDAVIDGSFGVLKQLQPHRNLESLSIVGYGGKRFPNWVGDPSFSKIVYLKLSECRNCTFLPPLGQLESLKELLITKLDRVASIGSEFYGNCMSMPFRSLKILSFSMMPQWHEWISSQSAFPLLQELHIRECPKLKKSFAGHLPSLTTLKIQGCQQLLASLPRSSRFQTLMVDRLHFIDLLAEEMEQRNCFSTILENVIVMNCDLLKCFPLEFFPKLKKVFIYGCPNLESLSALKEPHCNFKHLSSFEIGKCSNLVSFPIGGLAAPNLTVLRLRDCLNLRSLPDCMHSLLPLLINLEIVDCPELESFPEGGLPAKLESLKIENCDKLIAARMQWNLQELPTLSHFQIIFCDNMESFPEKMLFPSTLTSLKIWDLPNLRHIDYEGLQHLTCLRELEISNCPKLESLPEERLPASLSCFSIWQCPLLEQRCQREIGEDWPKISHIPCVEIVH